MFILTKGLEHGKHMLHLIVHLTKLTFLTKFQVENLVKMDKQPSKWPWLNQIDHYDLTFNEMTHIYLMI